MGEACAQELREADLLGTGVLPNRRRQPWRVPARSSWSREALFLFGGCERGIAHQCGPLQHQAALNLQGERLGSANGINPGQPGDLGRLGAEPTPVARFEDGIAVGQVEGGGPGEPVHQQVQMGHFDAAEVVKLV